MSPRRFDPSIVQARLATMRELLDDLAGLVDADITTNRLARHAVERILTQLVEVAAAVNQHVVATRLARAATSYADSFVLASECGLIDEPLRDALLPSIGLRNVLIHEYLEIDLKQVAAAIPLALDGYRRYVRQAAGFVAALDEP